MKYLCICLLIVAGCTFSNGDHEFQMKLAAKAAKCNEAFELYQRRGNEVAGIPAVNIHEDDNNYCLIPIYDENQHKNYVSYVVLFPDYKDQKYLDIYEQNYFNAFRKKSN